MTYHMLREKYIEVSVNGLKRGTWLQVDEIGPDGYEIKTWDSG